MKPQHFAYLAGSLLLIALVLLLSGGGQSNSTDKAVVPPDRLITVTGDGEVRVKPDLAQVSVRIWTHGASAKDAEALNSAFMKQVQAALTAAGADPESLDVTPAVLSTATYLDSSGATRISGFEARSSLKASVRNLAKVQVVVDAAMNAGATALDSITYSVENPEPARESAMKAALASARARATALLKAEGEKPTDLRSSEALPVETPPASPTNSPIVFRAQVRATFVY